MFAVEELGQEIAELAVHLDAATHRLLECVRQFDADCGWAAQGTVSCAHWLSIVALANRDRALTRVATPETESKLLDVALDTTGAQLERLCRGYRTANSQMSVDNALPPPERSVRRRDLPGGMVKLEVILSPDEADLVTRALDRAREVPHQQSGDVSTETRTRAADDAFAETPIDETRTSLADAMVALAESYLAGNTGTGNGGERFQVMVHLDPSPPGPRRRLVSRAYVGPRTALHRTGWT